MRAGISRVVVEIIILVIAVALALLIFSPISGYIFGSLGRTATVGGASQIQVLNAKISSSSPQLVVDVKNLGPGIVKCAGTSCSTTDFQVFIDGVATTLSATDSSFGNGDGNWDRDEVFTLSASSLPSGISDGNKQHNIVVYGPGGTQAQYLYSPSPS